MAELSFADASGVAHAYILSSADVGLMNSAALRIAAAVLCERGHDVPCGECRSCRKVQRGSHPDLIIIERTASETGKLRQNITVEQIRSMISEASVIPNEADGKVFIIKEAELMNLSAQNAALKLFEEPPDGVHFILCAAKPSALLPTVRSRCDELTLNGNETADEESAAAAKDYLAAQAAGDRVRLFELCTGLEKQSLSETLAFVKAVDLNVADIFAGRAENPGLNTEQLLGISALMERCWQLMTVNVSVKHLMGMIAVRCFNDKE